MCEMVSESLAEAPLGAPGAEITQTAAALARVLDSGFRAISRNEEVATLLPRIGRELDLTRERLSARAWDAVCCEVLRPHSICWAFHQDPFTKRAFDRPWGYPGDAPLLDYSYGYLACPPATSALGKRIFDYTNNVQSSVAVRERKLIVARSIDQAAHGRAGARVLSIAAGHLREADCATAVAAGQLAEFLAFDQDAMSLACVAETYGRRRVSIRQGSIRSLLTGRSGLRGFHLVYAAGLFDYLAERTAARLTRVMFDMLAPGGRLLVANYASCLRDIGYMEAYMRWYLIYRDEADMRRLTAEIPPGQIAQTKLFWDCGKCMLFLDVQRA